MSEDLKVGDEFPTFTAFNEVLDAFCKTNSTQLYIWDSQKIETAKKRGVKKHMEPALIYYFIKYACVRGGKDFKSRGNGIRDSR